MWPNSDKYREYVEFIINILRKKDLQFSLNLLPLL